MLGIFRTNITVRELFAIGGLVAMIYAVAVINFVHEERNTMSKGTRFVASGLRSALAACLTLGAMAAHAQVIDFSNVRGSGVNQQDVLMENVRLLVPVPNPFQPGTTTTVETNYNVLFRFDPTILHLVPVGLQQTGGQGASNCAAAQVTVFDALRRASAPLANASVTIGTRTATTNAQGVASFTGLPQGIFSVSAVSANYSSASQTAILQCTAPSQVTMALSPAGATQGGLASGQFRVILTWGQNPSDIDSHLTGPAADGTSRWHVYYSAKQAGDMCALDVDDTTSFGPETVTCPPTGNTTTSLRPGVYRYSVHHYAGSANIGASGANVRLEFSNGQTYSFTPPAATYQGYGDVWTVFEVVVMQNGSVSVSPVNSVMSGISSGSVARSVPAAAGTGFGQMEQPSLFQNLLK